MRQLFLLRHGKSSWDDPSQDDFDRPLNKRGRKAIEAMAMFMRGHTVRPALVLCSAAERTRQTYELVAHGLEGVAVSFEHELYEASRHDLVQRLRHLDDHLASVMVVGHNPGIEHLTHHLIEENGEPQAVATLQAKFPTGALAVLETQIDHWGALDKGCCRLTRFVRPADLD